MLGMSVARSQIDSLAELMQEFRLSEATWCVDGFSVRLSRKKKAVLAAASEAVEVGVGDFDESPLAAAAVPAAAVGTPISSPMTGIYYGAPSPGSPAFVKPGDTVTAGQVIGLIEAMKVFNEIPSPVSGTVSRIVAESGNVVQLGDPILFVD
jgi:acetyl-CoA carboxylase biotin carboxyl carrier protein